MAEEIGKLIDEYLPSQDDLDCEHPPGPRKQRVESILRVKRLHQLYSGKARAGSVARRLARAEGIDETELERDEHDSQAKAAEAVNLHYRPGRRESDYLDRPSSSDRGDEGWDEDVEGKA